ncbi:hypothetical protein TrRE_jg630, partial [Triparma retinervis]
VVVAAAPAKDEGQDGMLAFYNARTFQFPDCKVAGNKPEGIASSHGKLSCINEGSPYNDGTGNVDPDGSMTICDLAATNNVPSFTCTTKKFESANFATSAWKTADEFRSDGVRLFGPNAVDATVGKDLEPEGGCFTEDGKYQMTVLQDNNAYAMYDVSAGKYLFLKGFPHITAEGDMSDKDDGINIQAAWGGQTVKKLIMPDQVTCFTDNGKYYFMTANEGDTRDGGDDPIGISSSEDFEGEEIKLGKICSENACSDDGLLGRLLTTVFMPADFAQQACGSQTCDAQAIDDNSSGVSLTTTATSNTNGVTKGVFSIGGKSTTIFTWAPGETSLSMVWDSNTDFEHVTGGSAAWKTTPYDLCGACRASGTDCDDKCPFNSDRVPIDFDGRSAKKGPEPECVTTGVMPDGTRLSFVGLERTGGIVTHDITDPTSPKLQDYLNVRNWKTASADTTEFNDWMYNLNDGPESLIFISEADSPIGAPMLAAATPMAGRLTMYKIAKKAMRTDDGACKDTATCPYISSASGGEGSAIVDFCDVAVGTKKTAAGCDSGSSGKEKNGVAMAAGFAAAGVVAVIGIVGSYFSYRRGHDSGYSLAKDFDAKHPGNDI